MNLRFALAVMGALALLSVAGCGPKSLSAKMKSADKMSDKIGGLLDDVEKAYSEVDPKKAEEALKEARRLLDEPDMQYSPERELYDGRYQELAPKLAEVKEARKAKDIEDAVRSERAEIGPSLQAVKDATEAASTIKVDDKAVDAARDAAKALEKALKGDDDRRTLALKDPSFGGYLKRAKAEADKAREAIAHAEKKVAFSAGPVAAKAKAAAELKDSKAEKDGEKKRELLTAAAADYGQCLKTGLDFIKGNFSSEKIYAEGATTTVEAFLETCKAAQKSTEQAVQKLPKPKAKPTPPPAKKPKK